MSPTMNRPPFMKSSLPGDPQFTPQNVATHDIDVSHSLSLKNNSSYQQIPLQNGREENVFTSLPNNEHSSIIPSKKTVMSFSNNIQHGSSCSISNLLTSNVHNKYSCPTSYLSTQKNFMTPHVTSSMIENASAVGISVTKGSPVSHASQTAFSQTNPSSYSSTVVTKNSIGLMATPHSRQFMQNVIPNERTTVPPVSMSCANSDILTMNPPQNPVYSNPPSAVISSEAPVFRSPPSTIIPSAGAVFTNCPSTIQSPSSMIPPISSIHSPQLPNMVLNSSKTVSENSLQNPVPFMTNFRTSDASVSAHPVFSNGSEVTSSNIQSTVNVIKYPNFSTPLNSMYPLNNQSNAQLSNLSTRQFYPPSIDNISQNLGGLSVTKDGWNQSWGVAAVDLLQQRQVVSPQGLVPPKPKLLQEFVQNCSPDIFRCTLNKIPETQSCLQKSRMPFGILIHPFKDLDHLAVVSCNTIVRCRSCRTYINPFVVFKGERRWECNLCFRVNEVPEEFLFDPVSRTYGDPSRRPEVKEATIEFIAPQEYMLRPPQPATYLYVLDVSVHAIETGYLQVVCETLLALLDKIPGDRRTLIGFISFSRNIQFYLLGEGQKSVQMLEVGELDDVFIPSPEDLLVNLEESRDLIEELLVSLPDAHAHSVHTQSALGAAVTAASKLMGPIGGRISVITCSLPTIGPGALKCREDPNMRSAKDIGNIGPATDFYKKLALDCSGQQVAVDLFALNSHFVDLATLSGMSKFSGGSIYHFPGFHVERSPVTVDHFRSCFVRYLTRKIGFESVMRVRATRGLAITNFHGNFFVRSTDLLALPNVNPDAGFAMQVSLEDPLTNVRQACFQAALLYTSSKGERRIRVHTLCLPVTGNVHELVVSGDQTAIVGLLSKLAVDRCLSARMSDAREAVVNACVDILGSYRAVSGNAYGLPAPPTLHLLPLYSLALLKSVALRHGVSTKLDDRVFAMCELKTMPLGALMQTLYPDLYPVHALSEIGAIEVEEAVIPQPGRVHLSSEVLERQGAYLMDAGSVLYLYVRSGISATWLNDILGLPCFEAIPQPLYDDPLPELVNPASELMRNFVGHLQKNKSFPVPLYVIREDNPWRSIFVNLLLDDRSEGAHSYVEFLQFIKSQIK